MSAPIARVHSNRLSDHSIAYYVLIDNDGETITLATIGGGQRAQDVADQLNAHVAWIEVTPADKVASYAEAQQS